MAVSSWPIQALPGLMPQQAAQLQALGVQTTADLVKQGRSPQQRLALAEQLQLHLKHVNKWVALAQLAHIPGVGVTYCGLLLHAGISSPQQLATMPVAQLHRQLQRLQIRLLSRTDHCPDAAQVAKWVAQAKRYS